MYLTNSETNLTNALKNNRRKIHTLVLMIIWSRKQGKPKFHSIWEILQIEYQEYINHFRFAIRTITHVLILAVDSIINLLTGLFHKKQGPPSLDLLIDA